MNKQEFLEKLEKRLSILTEEEIEDILNEYGGYIDEKVKKRKMSESEAIKEFGNFDELVKEILSAYKINDKKTKNSIDNFFETVGDTIENLIESFSKKNTSEITRMVIEIILIFLIIAICRIPLEIIIDLGLSIFRALPYPLDEILKGIWKFVLELSYLFLAVIFFVKIFKAKYIDGKIGVSKEMPKKKADKKKHEETDEIEKDNKKQNIKEEKTDEVKIVKAKKENDGIDLIAKIFIGIVKVFMIIMLFPVFGTLLGLVIALGIAITLFVGGVHYIGILLCIISLLLFVILMFEVLIKFIFSKRNSVTRIFISIIIFIFLLGIGISITTVEIANSTYTPDVPKNIEKKLEAKVLDGTKYSLIDNWYYIEFIEDDSLDNNIKIEIEYYDGFADPFIYANNGLIEINYHSSSYSLKNFYNIFINDLKNKELHDYTKLFNPRIILYGSSEMIDKFSKMYHCDDQRIEELEETIDDLMDEKDFWKEEYQDLYDKSIVPSGLNE